jgi:cobaltochelatase CobN
MGGLNLSVRSVTGKDPDAYFADYRNRNNVRMQELKEAIGVETRSTVFNPAYIREVMKGKASSAAQITEVITNTYGWNVMKPDVIDNEMWNQFYDIYIKDSYNLGIQSFFRQQNPAAMQELTAVMMETARKGLWQASAQQLADIAKLHTNLVNEFGANGSGFGGSNETLQDFIAQKATTENVAEYKRQLQKMKTANAPDILKAGTVLKKDSINSPGEEKETALNGMIIVSTVLVVFIFLLFILRKKRKDNA